jgi:SAM-dependent methyltransferase
MRHEIRMARHGARPRADHTLGSGRTSRWRPRTRPSRSRPPPPSGTSRSSFPPSSPNGRLASPRWPRRAPGQRVLDVACGTGIVARTVADAQRRRGPRRGTGSQRGDARSGPARAAGDRVASGRRRPPPLRRRRVRRRPVPDGVHVLPGPLRALREMARVVTDQGTVAFSVPSRLDAQPAYAPFVEMVARHAGSEALRLLGAYFASGDLDELRGLVDGAGLQVAATRTHQGKVQCPSIDAFVATEVESTPLRERISDEVYARIREEARALLRPTSRPRWGRDSAGRPRASRPRRDGRLGELHELKRGTDRAIRRRSPASPESRSGSGRRRRRGAGACRWLAARRRTRVIAAGTPASRSPRMPPPPAAQSVEMADRAQLVLDAVIELHVGRARREAQRASDRTSR